MTTKKPRILTKKSTFTIDYPQAIKASEDQARVIWFASELGVEKDENDVRVKLTDGERHGLETVLKLFTEYESILGGEEFWGGKVVKMFPRPDIHRMAVTFSFIEIVVHLPFYDLINKTLKIATDDFYNSWKKDPILVERIKFINSYAACKDPLLVTSAFAFIEGAVLFSNFAYIKSLNSGGHNMCSHISAGVDASAKDENFHSMASAWLYNQTLSEMKELDLITNEKETVLNTEILQMAKTVYEHELRIIDMIFEKGGIRTITKVQIVEFVKNRIDVVLGYLNQPPLFNTPQGEISEWFYSALSSYKYSDFFSNQQTQYVRDWAKHKLVFNPV